MAEVKLSVKDKLLCDRFVSTRPGMFDIESFTVVVDDKKHGVVLATGFSVASHFFLVAWMVTL